MAVFYTQLLQWAFFRNGEHNKLLLVTSEIEVTALGILRILFHKTLQHGKGNGKS